MLFALIGCTRGSDRGSQITLSLSTEPSQLSSNVGIIIINVTGPGFAPILYQWDHESSCVKGLPCVAPASVNLSVPSGADRLIQVLTVVEGAAGNKQFSYADLKKSLQPGTTEVELTPTKIGNATMEAGVYGRYLDQANTGPTGKFDIRFKPLNGSPAMTVMTGHMYAGWFGAMVLNGDARFDYYLNNRLLMSDMHMGSAALNVAGDRILKVSIPVHERMREESGVHYKELEPAQKYFLGYFGPLAGSRKVCYENGAAVDLNGAVQIGTSTPLQWRGNTTAVAADNSYASPEMGGFPDLTSAPCTGMGTEFTSVLKFRHMQIGNGKDSMGGFRGPFRMLPMAGSTDHLDAVIGSVSGSDVTLNWQWLPGVAEDPTFKGSAILVRQRGPNADSNDLYGMSDGVDCRRAQDKLGFIQYGQIIEKGTTTAQITIPGLSSANSRDFDVVVCPAMTDGSLPIGGVRFHGLEWGSGGPSPGFAPALKIVGNSQTSSDLRGAPIGPGMRLFKSHVFNGSHRVVAQSGNHYLRIADVASAEIQVDDSATWLPISVTPKQYSSVSDTIASVLLDTALRDAMTTTTLHTANAAADSKVKFRFTLTGGGQVESESIILVGTAACGTVDPSPLIAVNAHNGSAYSGNSLFTSIINTDMSSPFRLKWSGCAGAEVNAIVDRYAVGAGGMDPMGCFDPSDIVRSTSNPLVTTIDPQDKLSTDCQLTSQYFTFFAPGGENVQNIVSHTILHSTNAASFGLLATVDDINAVGDLRFRFKMALMGASVAFKSHAILQNTDGRITSTLGGVLDDFTSWVIGSIANWFTTNLPTNNDHLSLVTDASPLMSPLRELRVTNNNSITGVAALGVIPNRDIVDVSSERLNGGSPLILWKDQSQNLKVSFIPSQNDNFVGNSIVDLGDFGPAGSLTFGRVILLSNSDILVAAQVGPTAFIRIGRINFSSNSVDWAVPYGASEDMRAFAVANVGGGVYRPVVVIYDGQFKVKYGNLPGYSFGSGWDNSSFVAGTVHTLTNFGLFLGLADKSYPMMAIGIKSGTHVLMHSFLDAQANTVVARPESLIVANGNDRATSAPIGFGAYAIIAYSSTAQTNSVITAFTNGVTACDTGADVELGIAGGANLSSMGFAPYSSGPYADVQPMSSDGASGFLGAFRPGGDNSTHLKVLPLSCAGAMLNYSPTYSLGSLAAPSSTLRGISLIGYGDLNEIAVFGGSSQFYWMRSR